ncbi:PepSY-associated TM helix domain-containing protein [Hyphomonas oceanitis]|uniref:PepSY-associated TM helix domain-containing protein n=1 Tax=Hyphomonas oceanitis TaxID=81033 RepID=UPI00300319F9
MTDTQIQNAQAAAGQRRMRYAFIKRQIRTVHWMSGAVCLIGMLLFAATGITLNHAGSLTAKPVITDAETTLTPALTAMLADGPDSGTTPALPTAVARQLKSELGADAAGQTAEWTDIDVYVALPRPGGDGWVSIDRETGEVVYEATQRGPVAYLNDLHKGRNTGTAWSWFLDIFAVATMLFCLSGLWLLQIHSARRASTWPLTIAGLAVPVLLLLVFVHL